MKKLSVLVLALVLVVSLASVSFAATTSFSGEVSVILSQGDFAMNSENAKVSFDFTKKYNDNLSAGLSLYYKWDSTAAVGERLVGGLDPSGFITFSYAPLTVNVKTSIGGGVSKDILTYGIESGAGVQVDYTVVEGLTATVVGNTAANGFGYVAKVAYTGNGLTVGAGYQADEKVDAGKEAIGAYASYTVAGITAAVEYNNRVVPEATSILAKVGGTFGPLTANAAFIMQDATQTLDDDNADQDWAAYEALRFNGIEGKAFKVDGSFKVIEPLTLSGNFQMVLDGDMSYKVGAAYTFESCKAEASYKAINFSDEDTTDQSAVNVTLTHTFAEGLVGSLSLNYDLDAEANATSYTAKVVATL